MITISFELIGHRYESGSLIITSSQVMASDDAYGYTQGLSRSDGYNSRDNTGYNQEVGFLSHNLQIVPFELTRHSKAL
tara:strand:- start:281 stop:514 length:234 start_codon:yes stop_codon:yes gene_type:complete